MQQRTKNWIIGTLVTGGPIIVGLSTAQSAFEVIKLELIPSIVWAYLSVLGILIFIIGIILWTVVRTPVPTLMPNFECYRARESELLEIRDVATQYLGDGVSPLKRMVVWHRKNPNCFRVIYKVRRKSRTKVRYMVGYYCIIPLNKTGVEKLKSKEISGAEFQKEHIASPITKPEAVYVGGIVADGILARGNARSVMHNDIANNWSEKTDIAYTTPTTPDGLRLVNSYGFSAVDANEEGRLDILYYRNI